MDSQTLWSIFTDREASPNARWAAGKAWELIRDLEEASGTEETSIQRRDRTLREAQQMVAEGTMRCGHAHEGYGDQYNLGRITCEEPVHMLMQFPTEGTDGGARTRAYCERHLTDLWEASMVEGDSSNVEAWSLWHEVTPHS